MSWMLVTDPSFRHMITAVSNGADGAPPLYHVIGYVWVRVFGATDLALRALSWVGFACAVGIAWITLRRWYSTFATAIGVLVSFSMSSLVLYQVGEARFYGLLTALVALAVYEFARLSESETVSGRALTTLVATHITLAYTHVYGIVYSGAILAAWIVADWRRGWWRPRLYAAIPLAWLAFVPWLPSLWRAAALGRPHGWIRPPRALDLLAVYGFGIHWLLVIVAVVLILATWSGMAGPIAASVGSAPRNAGGDPANPRPARTRALRAALIVGAAAGMAAIDSRLVATSGDLRSVIADPHGILVAMLGLTVGIGALIVLRRAPAMDGQASLILVALALFAVPFVGFVVSRTVMPIFVPRYFLPSLVGVAILMAQGSALIADVVGRHVRPSQAAPYDIVSSVMTASLLLGLALYPVWTASNLPRGVRPGAPLESVLPPGSTVIVDHVLDFMPMLHYQRRADIRYVWPADSAVSGDPRSSYGAMFMYRYMRTLERLHYLSPADTAPGSPLCTFAQLYIAPASSAPWLAMRVTADAGLEATPVVDRSAHGDPALALVIRPRDASRRPCIRGVERYHVGAG